MTLSIAVFPPQTEADRHAYHASIVRSLVAAHYERQQVKAETGLEINDDGEIVR